MPSPESASTDWHFGLTDLATRTRSTSPRNFRTHRMGYSAQLPPDWSVSLEYRLQTLPPTQAPRLRPPLQRHSIIREPRAARSHFWMAPIGYGSPRLSMVQLLWLRFSLTPGSMP